MKYLFILITISFFISCSDKNKVPSDIIQPVEMQNILWDVIRAQTLSSEIARKDSSVNEIAQTKVLTQKIFELRRTTSQAFNQSYLWYTNHPAIMQIIFDSMYAQNQRQNQLDNKQKYQPHAFDVIKKADSIRKKKLLHEQSF